MAFLIVVYHDRFKFLSLKYAVHIKIGKGAKQKSLDQIMLDDKKQQQIILDYKEDGMGGLFPPFSVPCFGSRW